MASEDLLRLKSMNAAFDEYSKTEYEDLLERIAKGIPDKVIPLMDELIEFYLNKDVTPRTIQVQLSDVYAPSAPRDTEKRKILMRAASTRGSSISDPKIRVGKVTAGIIAIILTAGSTFLNSYVFKTALNYILIGSDYLTSVGISAIINSIISSVAALPVVVYNNPYITGVLSFLIIFSYIRNEMFFKQLGIRAADTVARNTARSTESEQKARADSVCNWITAWLDEKVVRADWKNLIPFISGMELEDIQKLRADIGEGEGLKKFFEGHYHKGPSATGTFLRNHTEINKMVTEFISDLDRALEYLEKNAQGAAALQSVYDVSGQEAPAAGNTGGSSRRRKSSRKPRNKRKTIRKKVSKTKNIRKRTLNKKSKKRSKKLKR